MHARTSLPQQVTEKPPLAPAGAPVFLTGTGVKPFSQGDPFPKCRCVESSRDMADGTIHSSHLTSWPTVPLEPLVCFGLHCRFSNPGSWTMVLGRGGLLTSWPIRSKLSRKYFTDSPCCKEKQSELRLARRSQSNRWKDGTGAQSGQGCSAVQQESSV